jgi:hypothetical protein
VPGGTCSLDSTLQIFQHNTTQELNYILTYIRNS